MGFGGCVEWLFEDGKKKFPVRERAPVPARKWEGEEGTAGPMGATPDVHRAGIVL